MDIKELKKTIEYDNIIRSLLEKLLTTLDIRSVLDAVITAIQESFPFGSIAYVIWSGEGSEFSNLIYIHSQGPIGKRYLSSVQSDMQQFIKSLPDGVKNKSSLEKQLSKKMYYEFIAGKTDEKMKRQPLQFFVAPFRSGSSILGLFHISSGSQKFTRELINTVQKIIDTASISFEKIRLLAQAEKSRMEDLLRSMTNGVVMFDNVKKVVVVNPAARKIAGLGNKNFTLTEFIHQLYGDNAENDSIKGNRIDIMAGIDEMFNAGKIIHIDEFTFNKKYFEIFITPIRNPEEKITGGSIILHDITHIMEIDKVKSEFISLASHQLRTPISVINWYTEMLLSGDAGEINKEQKEYLEQVRQGNKQMAKLANDFLNISRIGAGKLKIEPKATCLAEMIEDIIKDECEPLIKEKGCRVLFNKPKAKLLKILVDPKLTRQVIYNLLTNAVCYSANKDKSEVVVELEEKGWDYIISIKDNGIGIAKKDQPKIFEKFFRAENAQLIEADGNGLSLYINKIIIEAHGGKIWFESTENKGTTFYASLPKQYQ